MLFEYTLMGKSKDDYNSLQYYYNPKNECDPAKIVATTHKTV